MSERVRTHVALGLAAVSIGVLVVLAAAAGPAHGARGLLKGLYDDTQFLYGNPDRAFPIVRQLRSDVIRVNLYWGGEFGVAPNRRPARPTDPEDPAYDWGLYDRAVRFAARHDTQVVFSIWGTPGWANRFRGLRYAPINKVDLRNFAFAAARRYGGSFVLRQTTIDADGNEIVTEERLPRVRHWLAWNEPNNPAFLFPQYRLVKGKPVIWSAREYARHLQRGRPGRAALARPRQQDRLRRDRAARQQQPAHAARLDLAAAVPARDEEGGRARLPRLRAPPLLRQAERDARPRSRAARPQSRSATSATLGKELQRLYGRGMRMWLTEYGYQTKPERLYAVTLAKQARYLTQAYGIARRHPKIDMMVWFMLRDDRNLSLGWQSGLFTASGARKPAFNAFLRVP